MSADIAGALAESGDAAYRGSIAQDREMIMAKKKSKAIKMPMSPPPSQKTVERLTRRIWKFSEQVRLRFASADEVAG